MRGVAMRATVAMSILIGSTAPATLRAMPAETDVWVRVDTPGAVLFGDADAGQVQQIAVRLERLRRILALAGGRIAPRAERPLYVYVFRDWKSAKGYLRDPTIGGRAGGMFVGQSRADYVVVAASPELNPFALSYHEFLHSVVRDSFPGAPLWFNEGLAEVFGTFWVNDHDAVIGADNVEHLAVLRAQGLMPWGQLFRVGPSSPAYREAAAKQRFHAQSWLLVHYLLLEPAEGLPRFGGRLERMVGADGALEFSPQAVLAAVDGGARALSAYLARAELPRLRLELPRRVARVPSEVRELDAAETLYRLGDLLAHVRDAPADTERHFERALRIEPGHVAAGASLGRIRARQGKYEEALELLRTALVAVGEADPVWSLRIQRDLTETNALLADDLVRGGHIQQALHTLRRGLSEIRAATLRREFERRIDVLSPE